MVRVRPANLRQVEYLTAMEDDHLLLFCMQVFCGASEACQPGEIPGCHGRRSLIVHAGILGASEASQPAASGIPGCHGRRSLLCICAYRYSVVRVRPTSLKQVEYRAAMEDDHLLCIQDSVVRVRPTSLKQMEYWLPWKTITYCAYRYSVVRVRPANLRQVEYLAAMKDDHLLCMQVFCGASLKQVEYLAAMEDDHLFVHAGILWCE